MESDVYILRYLEFGKKKIYSIEAKEQIPLSAAGIMKSLHRLEKEEFIQKHEDKEYSTTDKGKQLYECTKHLI